MQYQSLVIGDVEIEFHNSWTGEETVVVNGQEVSRKSSVWGTHHYFSLIEEGQKVHYILTTKVSGGLQVLLDVSKNGQPLRENVPVVYGTMPEKPQNAFKKRGRKALQEYDLEAALHEFERAGELAPKDPEIYFHMACIHSISENAREGFECLKRAVDYGWMDTDAILQHDMLAYLRLQSTFAAFRDSGFKAFDESAFEVESDLV